MQSYDPDTTFARHDSPLGRWSIVSRRVHPALRGVATQLWHGAGRVAYRRDRILPRAQSYLLINLGPPQYMVLRGEPEMRIAFDDIWFSGISEFPIDTEAPNGSVLLGVAVTATGAATLLRTPQHEIANRTGSFTDLIGGEARVLRDRLLDLRDAAARLRLVEAWLLDACVSARNIHPLVAWASQLLESSAGSVQTAQLARHAGCSRKHLAGLFRERVGLAPKTLARIHRFHRAAAAIAGSGATGFGQVAADMGYFDQSHLIRDFRQFAGLTPTEFARCAQPDALSIVLR
jgi:AraC-like DNA-binding protein